MLSTKGSTSLCSRKGAAHVGSPAAVPVTMIPLRMAASQLRHREPAPRTHPRRTHQHKRMTKLGAAAPVAAPVSRQRLFELRLKPIDPPGGNCPPGFWPGLPHIFQRGYWGPLQATSCVLATPGANGICG